MLILTAPLTFITSSLCIGSCIFNMVLLTIPAETRSGIKSQCYWLSTSIISGLDRHSPARIHLLIYMNCNECSLSTTQRGDWGRDAQHSTGVFLNLFLLRTSPHIPRIPVGSLSLLSQVNPWPDYSDDFWRPCKDDSLPPPSLPPSFPPPQSGHPGVHWAQVAPFTTWPNQTTQMLSYPWATLQKCLAVVKGEIIFNHFHFVPIWPSEKCYQSRCFTVYRKAELIHRLNKTAHFVVGTRSSCCSLRQTKHKTLRKQFKRIPSYASPEITNLAPMGLRGQ